MEKTRSLVCKNLQPLNEGFPTVVCGILASHIVDEMNKELDSNPYQLRVYPVVFNLMKIITNTKNDTIIKLHNARTVFVMELKLDVYLSLHSTIKDDLAQMIVDVYYYGKTR